MSKTIKELLEQIFNEADAGTLSISRSGRAKGYVGGGDDPSGESQARRVQQAKQNRPVPVTNTSPPRMSTDDLAATAPARTRPVPQDPVSAAPLGIQRSVDKKPSSEPSVNAGSAGSMGAEATPEDMIGKEEKPFKMPKRPVTPTPDNSTQSAQADEAPKPSTSYEVKKGDNLWNIVKQRGKSSGKSMTNKDIDDEIKRLAQLNKMKNPNLIMPGQKIQFEETETLNSALINAFDKIVSSKNSNIFQEAKKLHPNQKQLDKNKNGKLDSEDFEMLRNKKEVNEGDTTSPSSMGIKPTYGDNDQGVTRDKKKDKETETPSSTHKKNSPLPTKEKMQGKLINASYNKEEVESLFSEAELAYFEGVGKIAGKPIQKTLKGDDVHGGDDKSNATGSRSGTLSDEYIDEAKRGRPAKGESLGANDLHMNAKRAADNMSDVTHTFANGQKVKMTKGMGTEFMAKHRAARTPEAKDALLNHAHSSLSAFKDVVEGKPVPAMKKSGISLGGSRK